MSDKRPLVLSIAGYDPTGGAGVLADMKTLEQCRVQGMAVLTAHTLQTENTLLDITWCSLAVVIRAIDTLMSAYDFRVVKIGIVPDRVFLDTILKTVQQHNPDIFIIWDPVLSSSSGFRFFRQDDLATLAPLLESIHLLTPNYPEYRLMQQYGLYSGASERTGAVLLKGGHCEENPGVDLLLETGGSTVFPPEKIVPYAKHGSGCILSAAIAGSLATGASLHDAVRFGKRYVEGILNSNTSLLGYHYL